MRTPTTTPSVVKLRSIGFPRAFGCAAAGFVALGAGTWGSGADANAAVVVYEADPSGWWGSIDVFATTTTSFEEVGSFSPGQSTALTAASFAGLPGAPVFIGAASNSSDAGDPVFVGRPQNPQGAFFGNEFFATTGRNVLAPKDSNVSSGAVDVTFDTTVHAVSGWFLDAEEKFASTGISVNGVLYALTSNKGDNSKTFFGIVSDEPFTSVTLHFASASRSDSVGFDDFSWTVIPTPGTWAIAAVAGAICAASRGRRRSAHGRA